MTLFFNLKQLFVLCFLLICGRVYCGETAFFLMTVALFGMILAYRGYKRTLSAAGGVWAAAFLFNLWYVLNSWGNTRQYDYFNFVMHADYFLRNNFFIAEPSGYLQSVYFQPPLWGLISALTAKFCMMLGATQTLGFDCVRFWSLFSVSGAMFFFWRLMEALNFKSGVRLGLFTLFCFFPMHGIAANLVNNDAATYFLMMAAIYYSYRWYLSGKWSDCAMVAGSLLPAGMIKFSGLMVVPAIGTLCLIKILQERDKTAVRLWGQSGLIFLGAIAGFSWGLFLLWYHLPLVPPPTDNAFQNLSGYTPAERFFVMEKVLEPFADIRAGLAEPNVWLSLLKTSLFGEWSWQGKGWAYLLYGMNAVLAVLLVCGMASLFCYSLGRNAGMNIFVVVLVLTVLGAWINFWLDYPYFCSTEYRYVMILLPVLLLCSGNFLTQKSLPEAINYALAGGLILFVFARIMLVLNTI